jgi:hypothetical protein
MAYSYEELEGLAIDAIEKEELVFFDEIPAYVGCHKSTLYDHKLHESDDIKSAMRKNRIFTKKDLRNEWKKSENATVQIALYKLLSDKDEFARLSGQQVDLTSKGAQVTGFSIVEPNADKP